MKQNKLLLTTIIVVIVCLGAGFFGGWQYSKKAGKNSAAFGPSSPMAQQRFQQNNAAAGNRAFRGNSGLVNGEIIAKDSQSITVQLRQAGPNATGSPNSTEGSKIIFFAPTTEISKFVAGSTNDLQIGKQITASGSANPDGSITGQTIQIR
ncbi:MAG: hypothetical protein M1127_01275 [Patescibacteria group bacterium]|nr:hypothetical protein [Patescibacteria group bacterium]